MSPILGANPLDYDAKYPQTADTSVNEDAKMFVMERNIGKEVMFQIDDGTQFYGKISSIPNSEHYCVVVDRNGTPWEWYVREEVIHFVENTATDIWDSEGGKTFGKTFKFNK
jgi:hypothetical protein